MSLTQQYLCSSHMIANKPDVSFIDKNTSYTTIVYTAASDDRNINVKELEKVDKYQPS